MKQRNPNEIVHLQVKRGHTALYQGKAYGDRGTLQAPWRDAELLLKTGDADLVEPDQVPDVGDLPTAA